MAEQIVQVKDLQPGQVISDMRDQIVDRVVSLPSSDWMQLYMQDDPEPYYLYPDDTVMVKEQDHAV